MPASKPRPSPGPALPAYDAACAALAQQDAVAYQPAPPIEHNRCIAPAPVRVSAVRLAGGGTVTLEPGAVMRCAMALAMADWVRDAVAPTARDKLKAPLSGLRIADSYSCRTRDHLAGAKLSEHARANAVDIGAFEVGEGRWIAVNDAAAAAFLVTVRDRGCRYFNTVLGPGSDRWHTDNLHLDLEPRGPHHDGKYCH
ncbi:MAG TPA: extensin family protein [Hyphomicrobiales bacterium]|nr:extensin family protein [Hyphomicrobiales bacterium]